MVIAANMQGKGVEFHNALFSIEGNLNSDKLNKIIDDLEINSAKLNIDMSKEKVSNIVNLSSFLANGSGARGTPTFLLMKNLLLDIFLLIELKLY